jgi:quinoprotein glucose dehydrogenase
MTDQKGRTRSLLPLILALFSATTVFAQVQEDGEPSVKGSIPATAPAPATQPATRPATQPAEPPVPGRLVVSTWAPVGFLKNPVALSFDRRGRAYVAQTQRREGGEMQVRTDPANRVIPDHTFRSVEDRSRWAGDGDPAWGEQEGGKKETITLLEDSAGAGQADKAGVYYEGFNKNSADILAGVLWNEGNVYATCAPDLWMLRDAAGDGVAHEVHSLSHGYAVHLSYSGHNMHGLTAGPDGKIYFTIGDKGLNVTTREGRTLAYPDCGACLRCNPDGSALEVFAFGLRNPQEIAFDRYGNLFAVDNDGDYPNERERLVYITEGSDTGWRFNWQYRSKNYDVAVPLEERKDRYNPWMNERMWEKYFPGQAAYITPALANYTDGPCGFKYATEGALNDRYRGYFFVTEFPKATIRAFALKPKGAYFAMTDDQVVSRGLQCTGLALGPDGALYGTEWGKSGFKLGHTGSVIKLDDPTASDSPLRRQTHALLVKGPYQNSDDELVKLLDHQDMRVRLDAQFELVRRGNVAALERIAFTPGGAQMGRIHALWGLGQFVSGNATGKPAAGPFDKAALAQLGTRTEALATSDKDPELRAQSIKLLGEIVAASGAPFDSAPVIPLLADPSLRVRYFAAAALGKLKDRKAVGPLLNLVAENRPVDPYIRHAAVLGLVGIGDVDALLATDRHPSPAVRLAVVVALRRLRAPGLARFIADRDEWVATEAARAIHDDDSIPEALPALARVIDGAAITNEAFVRRALNANLRVGGIESIQRLARYASAGRNPAAMRVEALDILAHWESPAVNDRVEGRYRVWPQRSGIAVKATLDAQLPALLASENAEVARAAATLIDRLGIATDDAVFAQWVADEAKPAATRVTALRLLANRKYPKLEESVQAALASSQSPLRSEALRVLAETEPERAVRESAEVLSGESACTGERQVALHVLAAVKTPDAVALLGDWTERLLAGNVPPELQLDVIDSAGQSRDKTLKASIRKYESSLPSSDPLARYLPALAGGNASHGREIFTGHPDAACIRCHSLGDAGSTVGPNLAHIGSKPDKPRRYLLESMIEPNAFVVPGYGMATLKLQDGSEISGVVKSETDKDIQLLVDLDGAPTTIKKSGVASRTPPVSMMPPMGAVLTPSEIRDVIAYLSSLK